MADFTTERTRLRAALEPFLALRGQRVDAAVLAMWLRSLSDLSVDQVVAGIDEFLRTSSDYPTPAAIRKCSGADLDATDRATIAWAAVRQAIKERGAYATVSFDDTIINATIRNMGGWPNLCDTPTEQMTWKAKDFREVYSAVSKSGLGNASALPGIEERTNSRIAASIRTQAIPETVVSRIETGLQHHPAETALRIEERKVVPSVGSNGPTESFRKSIGDRMREISSDRAIEEEQRREAAGEAMRQAYLNRDANIEAYRKLQAAQLRLMVERTVRRHGRRHATKKKSAAKESEKLTS